MLFSEFQRRDPLLIDPEIHVNNQKTFKKPLKNRHTEGSRFTQRHNHEYLKNISFPGNQYDLPPTRALQIIN